MEVRNLSFCYGGCRVLRDISFRAEYGQFLSVLGPNGVGKSTLFRCMLGLQRREMGDTFVDGVSIRSMTAKQLARCVAYIPQSQHPTFNFSVLDMVMMGATSQLDTFAVPGKAQREQAEGLLDRLGIAHLRERGYTNISGGERQLVLVARAMAQDAKILIMDEPSSNLDFGNRIRVMRTMRTLADDGYAVVQSTHDPEQAYRYSDCILALYGGAVEAWGTPERVIRAGLVSKLYGLEVEVCSLRDDSVRVCVPGEAENGIKGGGEKCTP